MRIIIFSIAFLFLAFSAQSQVIKSAGVWYFLDVDSMTARPAVLPNGTELAYIIGTKTVYYWNRNTSTWTAYGSTFNRDSIYFDSSIIGSGTLSDPWRVDSTLFATITAVGDSIAAALSYVAANYFPLQGGTLTGIGGAGYVGFPSQVSAPGTPASGLNVYAQGSSFNWKGTDGFERQFASTLTGGRTYTLPDVSGTFALGTGTTNRIPLWTATNTIGSSNIQDNNTAVSILNSKPFAPGQWTTAGRPTGVTGYTGYNTTGNGIEWYQGSRWAYALESTFARGTSTYVPHFDANGQIAEDAGLRYDAPSDNLGIGGAPSAQLHLQGNKSAASWTTNGIGLRISPATYTNTTSSGTITEIAAHSILAPTFSASSPTTYTRSANLRLSIPVSGANVTQTERFALLAENAYIGRLVTEYGSSVFLGSQISQTLTKANTAHYTISRAGGASAALYGQATANGSSAYGVVGDALGNSGSATLLTGVYGEATNVDGGTANGSSAIGLSARVNSAKNDTTSHIIGVQSYVNLVFQGGTGTKINTATAFYGFPITRNNHSAKEINGFYFPGLAAPSSSPIPISNIYRPLRVLKGNTTSVLKTWSLIDHKTTIGSANESSQELDVYGDFLSRDTIFNTTPPTHATVDGFATWKSTAQGYALGKATFGTGLSFSGGVLSVTGGGSDGNGIYSGSATLSNHTTRARIPNDGNLLFSQTYNGGADSTYWQIVNYGDGERALNFGLTDTASTGYARASFYSDGTGVMNWGFETSDAVFGNTLVRAFEGDLLFSVNTGSISLSAPVDSEIRMTGMVRAKQEGYYEINSTSSPQNLSNTYSDNFINQGGTQATFTLVFPASPEDGQILKITYNNNISTLTLDGNGNTIVGTTVTTAVEGSQRVFKFYAGEGVWIRQN